MRYTYEHMKSMLQGAYKKLKSYYFYDKTLLFIKKKIAEFESDDGCFQQTFDVLAKALISENSAYFEELINQLDYRVFPKRLVAASAPTSTIVGTIDHHKNIAKVNFFIDVPIELLILDCLWTLCIAKISNKKYGTQACSYAGKFKASVFYFDQDDLYEGIDWESNRCFEPYYENYSRWQKDAFSKLRQGLLVQNQLMLSLDLKSFYYSVRFEFDSLSALLSDDSRLSEISFISHVEEKLYLSYTKLISKYKKGINIKNNATIFPIGLLSPILLRELYLYAFDQKIKFALNPTHYGRYVDDMIIIIPAEVQANNVTQNYVCNLLKEKGLIRKEISIQNEDFTFVGFESIAIQREKINCFFFEQNASNVLIEVAEKQIRDNSSEANLLPEFDVIKNHFNDIAYFFNSVGGSTKIRDIGILQSNNYAASRSITLMKQLIYKISSFTIELANALLFCTDISDCRILVTSRTIRLIADSFFHQSMADIVSFTEAITASAISGYSERCLLTMLSTSGWGSSFTTLIFSLSVFSLEPTDTFSSNLSYDSTAPGSGSFRCCRYIS